MLMGKNQTELREAPLSQKVYKAIQEWRSIVSDVTSSSRAFNFIKRNFPSSIIRRILIVVADCPMIRLTGGCMNSSSLLRILSAYSRCSFGFNKSYIDQNLQTA